MPMALGEPMLCEDVPVSGFGGLANRRVHGKMAIGEKDSVFSFLQIKLLSSLIYFEFLTHYNRKPANQIHLIQLLLLPYLVLPNEKGT
jgi:hypothetical protein